MIDIKDIQIFDTLITNDGKEWIVTDLNECIKPENWELTTVILGENNYMERSIPLKYIKEVKHLKQ